MPRQPARPCAPPARARSAPASVLGALPDGGAWRLHLRSLTAMPVERRELLNIGHQPLAGDVLGKELGHLFQAQFLGTGSQEEVEEVEIFDTLGKLEAELGVRQDRLA